MGSKVLVVDDEPRVREALRLRLEHMGCEVIEADSRAKAEEVVSGHRPEIGLVILDLRLESLSEEDGSESGLRFLEERLTLQMMCSECGVAEFMPRVIVLTSYPNWPSCRKAFLAGVFDYLDKNDPGVWDILLEAVKNALRQPSLRTLSLRWIEDHFDEVQSRYGGRILALRGEEVVAEGPTLEEVGRIMTEKSLSRQDCFLVQVPEC